MIVEYLLQIKSTDHDLFQRGTLFLQTFASDEETSEIVQNCGGGYIL
jgi:hypothetical protein